ncbi:MAG: GldG family protein, partial [Polyangiaceae bacterium]|nr:GldG family protein [Polyangiaceae bacterium]
MTARVEVARGAHPRGRQLLDAAGVVAAVLLAAMVNVLAARHFTRWDWTRDRRWSLSPATLETLRGLERTIDVWVTAGPGDALEPGLRELLASYTAESRRLDVHWIDPDRDTVQLVDLQRKYGLESGRAEDGRVATDAVVILASGEKHWFLTAADLFEASRDDTHVKPREERAITQGIRDVIGGDKTKLCFTVGHGELSLEPTSDDRSEWLGSVRDLLEKNNYELASVDPTAPDTHEPFAGCRVVVVAGPRDPFAPAEENRLRSWALEGGSVLVAVGPIEASTPSGMAASGLDGLLAPFGIAANDDLVHDTSAKVAIPGTHGEGFFVSARPHPVTASLASAKDGHPPRIAAFFSRSFRHVSPPGAAPASDLLVTGDGAYAKTTIAGAASWNDAPPREPEDPKGPFVVAMASERAGPREARLVAIG